MKKLSRRTFLRNTLGLTLTASVCWANDKKPKEPSSFQIGLSESLIAGQISRAVAPVFVQSMSDIFAIPDQPHAIIQIESAVDLAKKLHSNELKLAIMTGVEYGWLGPAVHPLVPLVNAYTSDIRLKACMLVHADSQAKSLLDLHNQTIAVPHRSQFHTRVFLHNAITKIGGNPAGFFNRVLDKGDVNDGIERVLEKEALAVLVDLDSWITYQERMPGRARKLSILVKSPTFPTAAVLYHPGNWKPDDLQRMKDVLLTANQRAFTRQILNLWRISKFVSSSSEYEQIVQEIVLEIPHVIVPAVFARAQ